MRLAWATDIHLNFLSDEEARAFCLQLKRERADALAITGDIAEAPSLERYVRMLADEVGAPLYFVLGNHDFYRGDLAGVRAQMAALTRRDPRISWMPERGVVSVADRLAIVGQDGWADGWLGDPEGSRVELNDWRLIADLFGLSPAARLDKLRALGRAEADALAARLEVALARHRSILVLTHVPPFRETCWHEGAISNDEWLPWFTCRAVGEVLRAAAERRPDARFTVLCGHTHGGGEAQILPNLVVYTGPADYGAPQLAATLTL
jgi:3',5'-cyclic AMP phosphodiesterase CpdA